MKKTRERSKKELTLSRRSRLFRSDFDLKTKWWITFDPCRASSRAKGIMPNSKSAPELSTKMATHLYLSSFGTTAEQSSISHGRDWIRPAACSKSISWSRVCSISCVTALAPQSMKLPTNTPVMTASHRCKPAGIVSIAFSLSQYC